MFSVGKNNGQKTAFSLIELSIVLIIIGLLIAGITGGASLIKSAELRSIMGEARAYNVSVNSFYVQYDSLPGDYKTSLNSGPVGDGDGVIEWVNNATTNVAEGVVAWQQMIASGTIENTFTPSTTITSGTLPAQTPGTTIPSSKIKGGGWIFDNVTISSSVQSVLIATGAIASTTSITSTVAKNVTTTGVLTPADALSIDTKLDDGIANTGKVSGLLANCFSGATYTTTNTSKDCALAFQIDVLN